MTYEKISSSAKNEIPAVVESIVRKNEQRFVDYLNNAQPLTPRVHALELIPGIGKTYLNSIIQEREKKPFQNYDDIESRAGLKEPIKHLTQRILEEISGETRMNIFVKR
jgi:putative nucleotide binding protein